MVMEALCAGWGEPAQCIVGDPPDDGNPFAIYGQVWGAERLLPDALKHNRPFWYIDNGYWRPGRGNPEGYYRICYRSMGPVFLPDADAARGAATGVKFAPWRPSGRHILFALPGADYGAALGFSMPVWIEHTKALLKRVTDRPIITRDRKSLVPLADHLRDCWAVVTHSSNVAVEAVLAGVPVFVVPGSSAAPVGNVDLANLERPAMPDDREIWWTSLMCQQFTPAEMRSGLAYRHLIDVRAQIDAVAAG